MGYPSWQEYAAWLDGKLFTTADGVEVRLRVERNTSGDFGTTVHGEPTNKGMRSAYYRIRRTEYRDHWCYCWSGELPAEVVALWQDMPVAWREPHAVQ